MPKISYSKKADSDLLEMILHIEQSSPQNALKYLERYKKKILLLALNPEMGTYCSNKNIQKNCRILIFESHVIIYSFDANHNEIFIIRIFHHSVNYKGKI